MSWRSANTTLAGKWDDLIVLCAANDFDTIKLADQHMAENLAAHQPVLYVDPPISLVAARRRAAEGKPVRAGLRLQSENLARLTLVVHPFPTRRFVTGLTAAVARFAIARTAARLTSSVQAMISGWALYPVLGACGERVSVYWAQDDFVGGARLLGLDATSLLDAENRSAAAADVIVAANPTVAQTWRERGYQPLLIPYGADTGAYADVERRQTPDDVALSGPIAGFVGHINARIDLALLEATADRGIGLLLIGPRDNSWEPERWRALLARPNVAWLGPKPFGELPGYYNAMDVGLVPYGASAFNEGSFPLKTLEYLAAGRPVVSTNLPASRWLDTDLVTIAEGASTFAEAVAYWAHRQRTLADVSARRAFAAQHDWATRAAAIRKAIAASDRGHARPEPAASLLPGQP